MNARSSRRGLPILAFVVFALVGGIATAIATFPTHAQQDVNAALPKVVGDALARAGLHSPSNIRQRGPNYTANAFTRTGAPVKVVIHGTTGAIIGYRVITPEGPAFMPGRP